MESNFWHKFSAEEYLSKGSIACAGCGAMIALRHALKVLGKRTIFINPTGCVAVIMQMGVPRVPHFHTLFENGPSVISGIDAALKIMGKRKGLNLLCFAGDGATADIGLSSLSGAIERGHRFIYICYDNESYMNTGGQRSSTTPFGARTSTTPIGSKFKGEMRPQRLRKDIPKMMAAQGCPYVATASIAYIEDYITKVRKASEILGPSFIHIHTPCPTGWGFDPKDTVKVARAAVLSGFVELYEVENGKKHITLSPSKKIDLYEYMKLQHRFVHQIRSDDKRPS
jgi:pyruvate ferredoxin oxidoreductase beta subunit